MKVCIALDLSTVEENIALAKKISGMDVWLKVGLRSFIRNGAPLINSLHDISGDFKIFLDLKLHDIPNTMADAAESISCLGVDMFNIHASAGKEAMACVMERVRQMANPPYVLAVTALTSFDKKGFKAVYGSSLEEKAVDFAKDAYESGLNGVVCSVFESALIKSYTSQNFLTLTPGIRPFGEEVGDQKRVATIKEAKAQECDFIVLGRPIYQSDDPRGVVNRIFDEMAK
ncbi:MAG: orotidine-5'-phosphate decarboxylase [Campylobacteraceae bacterium]|nr:orotidine-5'-phosphate decarboxylase [Campylobacteraceae bacterium]